MAGDLMALRLLNGERRNAAIRTEFTDIGVTEQAVKTALIRLAQIENASSPTNAQVVQAVRDIALYLDKTIRVVIGQ